jgi:hypothetical protein
MPTQSPKAAFPWQARSRLLPAAWILCLTLSTVACTGTIESGAAPTGGSGGAPSTGGAAAGARAGSAGFGTSVGGAAVAGSSGTGGSTGGTPPFSSGGTASDPEAAGPMPLRHLTSREYRNSVSALVGDQSLVEDDVPSETSDPTFEYYPFRRPGSVGTVEAETLQLAAEKVAKNVAGNLDALLPCQPATAADEASCARSFIESFGRRAYRRPLTAAEISRLEALYTAGRSTLSLDFRGAIALLVEGILQSPAFYYVDPRDVGPAEREQNAVKLGAYALASRLSYFLWGSVPDAELLDQAAAGGLSTVEGVTEAARRLAGHARAHDMMADFADDLLDLDILLSRGKDPETYPSYGLPLQEAMREEIRRYAAAVSEGDATLSTLLTSRSTFVNGPLAAVYGLSGISGDSFTAATLPAGERGGLLTLSGFLANTGAADGSVPPRRGKFVYTRLLCTDLPPPPNEIPAVTPPMPGLTTRARFELHDENPCAAGCHSILDGIGFAFEHYDGIGAYRTLEEGAPVDSATSYAFDDVNLVPLADAVELGRVLAAEPLVQACFAKQWLRYALHRPEATADTASLDAATAAFRSAGGSIRELWVALASSRTFRYRTPAPDEVLP